jgi:hypothetical protein
MYLFRILLRSGFALIQCVLEEAAALDAAHNYSRMNPQERMWNTFGIITPSASWKDA